MTVKLEFAVQWVNIHLCHQCCWSGDSSGWVQWWEVQCSSTVGWWCYSRGKWHSPTSVPRDVRTLLNVWHRECMSSLTVAWVALSSILPKQRPVSLFIPCHEFFLMTYCEPNSAPGHHCVLMKVMATCPRADFGPICHMGAGTLYVCFFFLFFWMSLLFIFVFLLKVQMKS